MGARHASDANPIDPRAAQQALRMRTILLAFVLSILLLGLKIITYRMTHSSAVLSDALESIINVVAGAFAAISIWVAAKPPDPNHPYGHGKIEYFSAGFEGALIVLAAAGIFYTGIRQIVSPRELPNLSEGALLLIAATIANAIMAMILVRTGKRTDSIALIADGKHLFTDVFTSLGVVAGLMMVRFTGWLWMDGAVACLVGVHILIAGSRLVIESSTRLMDASDPRLLDRITELLNQHRRPDWIDVHQLRAWRAGSLIHVDLHLVLPGDVALREAHHEAKAMENLLIEAFHHNISVLIHMDPCDVCQCPQCMRSDCHNREKPPVRQVQWSRDVLTRKTADKTPKGIKKED
jgi:cation diffusion facilitator family transporter